MENENNENINSQTDAETTENNETETQETETGLTPEEIQTLKDKAEKADELEKKNKQLYERLKKGEKKEEKTETGLTPRDVILLTGAGYTHEEDIEIIEKWAKFNGVSVKDALGDSTLKTVLSTKQEERRTAQATQTKGGARGVSTPSIDSILADASKGKIPEKDDEISRLAEARMAKRKQK